MGRSFAGHLRPITAASDLFQDAIDKSGLIAHHAHLKIQETVVKLKMDKPER